MKLNPRTLMKNPVMFVVEIGAVVTSYDLIRDRLLHLAGFGFELQITLWLWFTVLFANFAEAMAEGRGKGAGGHAAQGARGNNGAAFAHGWLRRGDSRVEAARGGPW